MSAYKPLEGDFPMIFPLLIAVAMQPVGGTAVTEVAATSWQPSAAASQPASEADSMRADALALEPLINRVYAYPERLPNGRFELTPRLRAEAETVADRRSLLRFVERALMLLADHHAITGASFPTSYAVVPTYADLWIEPRGSDFLVEAVRPGSPAAAASILPGDVVIAIDDVRASDAVTSFWNELGTDARADRPGFAARVLAAGRRDRARHLTIQSRDGPPRTVELASLYAVAPAQRPLVETSREGRALLIRINDALGESATIAAFDAAMRQASPRQRIIVDLTNTPSGGNTVVARAILGWFVDRPRFYQVHNLPAEQRETGIARQWVEQVLPRPGMRHRGPVEVRVGRWTGSMGEGLALGFDAIGASVRGSRMAGLLGAIYDHRLPNSGLVVKIPTERLMSVTGQPREAFVPERR